MSQETEVISCPACQHLLRVPLDWLGQPVQCPECRAKFRAPIRTADGLSAPALLEPAPARTHASMPRKRLDPLLLLPAFGLLFVGFAGMVVGGINSMRYLSDREEAKRDVLQLIEESRKRGLFTGGPEEPAARARHDEQFADEQVGKIRVLIPVFTLMSAIVFLGGVAMAVRRGYRLAQIGCILASVNVAYGCCIPGAVAGLWGFLMLNSAEGRAHFGK